MIEFIKERITYKEFIIGKPVYYPGETAILDNGLELMTIEFEDAHRNSRTMAFVNNIAVACCENRVFSIETLKKIFDRVDYLDNQTEGIASLLKDINKHILKYYVRVLWSDEYFIVSTRGGNEMYHIYPPEEKNGDLRINFINCEKLHSLKCMNIIFKLLEEYYEKEAFYEIG